MKSDNLLHEGDERPHDQSSACWCNPIRQRYDALKGRWAQWDGEAWVDLPDPQPVHPEGYQAHVGNVQIIETLVDGEIVEKEA